VVYIGSADTVVSYDHEKAMAQQDSIRKANAIVTQGGK